MKPDGLRRAGEIAAIMAWGPHTLEIAGRSKLFGDGEDAWRPLLREVGDQNVYEVQPGNMPMLKVFEQSGLSIDVHREPEGVRVTLRLS